MTYTFIHDVITCYLNYDMDSRGIIKSREKKRSYCYHGQVLLLLIHRDQRH
jgi:hypothetical protein